MDATRKTDLAWRKPSVCPNAATCVEVAELPNGGTAIRDGKNPQGPQLHFGNGEWTAFVEAVKAGEFDLQTPR